MERPTSIPIVCTLAAPDLQQRRATVLAELYHKVRRVHPLADGYALSFGGDAVTVAQIMRFVQFERDCCAFLTFELLLPSGADDVTLTLRGEVGVKQFIASELGLLPQR